MGTLAGVIFVVKLVEVSFRNKMIDPRTSLAIEFGPHLDGVDLQAGSSPVSSKLSSLGKCGAKITFLEHP